jgi:hypothetical protein
MSHAASAHFITCTLIGLCCFTALDGIAPASFAAPARPGTQVTRTSQRTPFVPPQRGLPSRREGAGSR